jgi:hypothetical protein
MKVLGGIVVDAVFVLPVVGQPGEHPASRLFGESAAGRGVDGLDGSDRVGQDLVIVQVDDVWVGCDTVPAGGPQASSTNATTE